jgi:hypothetical protein
MLYPHSVFMCFLGMWGKKTLTHWLLLLRQEVFTGRYVLNLYIQSLPGGKVNIHGGRNIGHSKQSVYTRIYMCHSERFKR